MKNMKSGIGLITEERNDQILAHGFTPESDVTINSGNELRSAAMFALSNNKDYYPSTWDTWFENKLNDKRARLSDEEFDLERLKIAGALIAAEIDRLIRL